MAETIDIKFRGVFDASSITAGLNQMKSTLSKVKLPNNLNTQFTQQFNEASQLVERIQQRLQAGFKTKSDVTGLNKDLGKLQNDFNGLVGIMNKVQDIDLNKAVQLDGSKAGQQIATLKKELEGYKQKASEVATTLQTQLKPLFAELAGTGSKSGIGKKIGEIFSKEDISNAEKLEQALKAVQLAEKRSNATPGSDRAEAFRKMTEAIQGAIDSSKTLTSNIERTDTAIKQIRSDEIKNFETDLQNASNSAEQTSDNLNKMGDAAGKAAIRQQQLRTETERLGQHITYFFGLTNGVRLFRRAISDTINTVKELDKAMTETAVVSDETIGSMWDKLPQYTKAAQELGVAISDVISAQTLYVQQGLDLETSMGMAVETMKMARIAGLEASAATDAMTAAVRGFKMELGEDSATRVLDVYSNLAKNTASDVEEISTAMSKVASLANSANMEFETTAAFLAQVIETTRESAETAGTALKTVVARFSEVKKLYSENELSGTDEEGQEIDVNKISTALRTAGINLNEYFLGNVGLDDIFLELAEKWDSLTEVQQRYIATQAAGSRQQSRFIAMMSDYERTIELQEFAYDSAGAGEEQFDKTLESLQTRLAQLKAAWQEFMMGIANNEMIGKAIDMITNLLNTLNKLTNSSSGLVKMFSRAGILVGGFSIGKSIFGGLAASISSIGTQIGHNLGIGIKQGASAELNNFGKEIVTQGGGFGGLARATGTYISNWQNNNGQTLTSDSFQDKVLNNMAEAADKGGVNYFDLSSTFDAADKFAKVLGDTSSSTREQAKAFKEYYDAANQAKVSTEGLTAGMMPVKGALDGVVNGFHSASATLNQWSYALGQLGFVGLATTIRTVSAAVKVLGLAIGAVNTITKIHNALVIKATVGNEAFGASWLSAGTKALIAGGEMNAASYLALGVWGLVAAAIAGLVVGIIAFNKKQRDAEVTLEKLEEDSKSLSEEANNATTAYHNLTSALDGLDSKREALDNLTEGTTEWTAALLENNQAVLDLVASSNLLPEDIQVGKNGILSLTESGRKAATEDALARMRDTQQDYQFNKMQTAQLKADKLYQTMTLDPKEIGSATMESLLQQKIIVGGFGGAQANLNQQVFDDIKEYALGTKDFSEIAEINAALEEAGTSVEEFANKIRSAYNELDLNTKLFVDSWATQWADNKFDNLQGAEKVEAVNNYIASVERLFNGNTLDTFASKSTEEGAFDTDTYKKRYHDKELKWAQDRYGNDVDVDKNGNVTRNGDTILHWADAREEYNKDLLEDPIRDTIEQILNSEKGPTEIANYLKNGFTSDTNVEYLNQQIANYWTANKDLLSKLYDSEGDFAEQIQQDQADYKAAVTDATNFMGQGFGNKALNTDQINKMSDMAFDALTSGGEDAKNALVDIFEKADEEQINAILNYDWEQPDAVKNFNKYLTDLGLTMGKIKIDDLNAAFENFSHTIETVNADKIGEQFTELAKIGARLSNPNNKDNSFTKEEKNALVNAGVADEKYFVWDAESDKFDYTGDLGTIITLLGNIYGKEIEEAKTNLKYEEQLAGAFKNESRQSQGKELLKNLAGSNSEAFEALFGTSESEEIETWSKNMVDKAINTLMELSVKDFEAESSKLADDEALTNYSKTAVGVAAGVQVGRANDESTQNNISEIMKRANDLGIDNKYTQKVAQIQEDVLNGGYVDIQEIADVQGLAAAIDTLTEAQKRGQEAAAIESQAQNLLSMNLGLTYAQAVKLASMNTSITEGVSELVGETDDFANVLGKAERGTSAYQTSLDKIKKSANKVLNQTEDLSEEFYNNAENLKLMQKVAEGDTDALKELSKAAAKDIMVTAQVDPNAINDVMDALDNMPDNYTIGMTLDQTDWGKALSEILDSSGLAVEQIQAILDSLGFSPNVTYEEMEVGDDATTYSNGYTEFVGSDNRLHRVQTSSISTSGGVSTVTVPVFGSGGAGKSTYSGAGAAVKTGGKSGGGGGGGGGAKKGITSQDRLHNKVDNATAQQKERNQLEREYNRLLKVQDNLLNQKDYLKNITAQINNLKKRNESVKEELALQKEILAGRQEEMDALEERFKYQHYYDFEEGSEGAKFADSVDLSKYGYYDEEAREFKINYDEIRKLDGGPEDQIKYVEEFLKFGEEASTKINDQYETVEDLYDSYLENTESQYDVLCELRDNYLELEDRTLEALVNDRQSRIDEAQELSDLISEDQSEIIDNIQQVVDEQRKLRKLQDQQDELAQKEARLAYLRRDTSGANASEIKSLEDELINARQDYQDTLVDNMLEDLNDANQTAQEQREKEIELMQAQLDYQQQMGMLWDEVHTIITGAANEDGTINVNSEYFRLMQELDGFNSMSAEEQAKWMTDLQSEINAAIWMNEDVQKAWTTITTDIAGIGTAITEAAGKITGFDEVSTKLDKLATDIAALGERPTSSGGGGGGGGGVVNNPGNGGGITSEGTGRYEIDHTDNINPPPKNAVSFYGASGNYAFNRGGQDWYYAQLNGTNLTTSAGKQVYINYYDSTKKSRTGYTYKTGGLADYTGPAWLDGTPSKPEMVLNAEQTQNFVQLRDLLSEILTGSTDSSISSGDNYYNFDIKVDQGINSDYDIDRWAERIKMLINKDARYRNANAINFMR